MKCSFSINFIIVEHGIMQISSEIFIDVLGVCYCLGYEIKITSFVEKTSRSSYQIKLDKDS